MDGFDMSQVSRRRSKDTTLQAIREALKPYEASHARARVEFKRQNSVSVRVRILDPDFEGLDRAAREDRVWALLDKLPAEVRADITMLLLLTPDEAKIVTG